MLIRYLRALMESTRMASSLELPLPPALAAARLAAFLAARLAAGARLSMS